MGDNWRKTDDELKELARQIICGQVFMPLTREALECSFGPLLTMWAPSDPEAVKNIGAVYEDYAKAVPRSLNGYPMFFSCQIVHKDDVGKLDQYLTALQQALNSV